MHCLNYKFGKKTCLMIEHFTGNFNTFLKAVKPWNSFTKPKYLGMFNSPSITKTSIIKDMKKKV